MEDAIGHDATSHEHLRRSGYSSRVAAREASLPVDRTLRQIIVGFRYVGAVWISVIGIVAIVEWDARASIVLLTLIMAWVWAAVTGFARRSTIRGWPFLLSDLAVGVWTAAAPLFTDQIGGGTFSGGYPFSTVLVWAFARGIRGGVVGGVIVSAVAVTPSVNTITTDLTNAIIYVAGGGVAGWAFNTLRRTEERRLEVETLLATERAERIRSEERAEVAAHLHDSVLQTLALIQKRSSEAEVGTLARRQERELRNWLYGAAALSSHTLAGALEELCAEIEDVRGIHVELVTVSDAPLTDGLRALVAATGEAVTNAAKFSGVDKVSVFGEVAGDVGRVFVRDRGTGFDPDAIEDDRRGIRDSIIGRMERHGGTATVTSGAGRGTEIVLTVPRVDS
jgi:signal transduction histidine kinase